MDSVIPFAILFALVLVNGFFVGAEFALVAAPKPTIAHRAAKGVPGAKLVDRILRSPKRQDRFFATSQLGITIASLGLGMYGEHVLADRFVALFNSLGASRYVAAHALASVTSVAILTYFHVVIGEVVPKAIALQFAGRVVIWITPIMVAVNTLAFPLVALLHSLASGTLRLAGIRRQPSADRFYTPEELQLIVEESQEGGLLKASAGRMLAELFEFGDLTAGQAMVPRVRVRGLPVGAAAEEVREAIRTAPHTRYPVYNHDLDHIVGMVHVKDLLPRLVAGEPIHADATRALPVWRRCDVAKRRWPSSSTSMAARPASSRSRISSKRSWARSTKAPRRRPLRRTPAAASASRARCASTSWASSFTASWGTRRWRASAASC
jgi:CBS domain containing-hemolysin-like protein